MEEPARPPAHSPIHRDVAQGTQRHPPDSGRRLASVRGFFGAFSPTHSLSGDVTFATSAENSSWYPPQMPVVEAQCDVSPPGGPAKGFPEQTCAGNAACCRGHCSNHCSWQTGTDDAIAPRCTASHTPGARQRKPVVAVGRQGHGCTSSRTNSRGHGGSHPSVSGPLVGAGSP